MQKSFINQVPKMGNKLVRNEPDFDVDDLSRETDLSGAFVGRLSARFKALDKEKKG